MFKIQLNKLSFFSHHGLHDEEAETGNDFEIDVSVEFDTNENIHSIGQTINYVAVYEVIKKHMSIPVALLETLAQDITEDIYSLDNRITSIHITINKLHPPIRNFVGSVGVSYSKAFLK